MAGLSVLIKWKHLAREAIMMAICIWGCMWASRKSYEWHTNEEVTI